MGKMTRNLKRTRAKRSEEKVKQVIDKSYRKGYEDGVQNAIDHLGEKLMTIGEIKGVGEMLSLKIAEHLGYEHKGDK